MFGKIYLDAVCAGRSEKKRKHFNKKKKTFQWKKKYFHMCRYNENVLDVEGNGNENQNPIALRFSEVSLESWFFFHLTIFLWIKICNFVHKNLLTLQVHPVRYALISEIRHCTDFFVNSNANFLGRFSFVKKRAKKLTIRLEYCNGLNVYLVRPNNGELFLTQPFGHALYGNNLCLNIALAK